VSRRISLARSRSCAVGGYAKVKKTFEKKAEKHQRKVLRRETAQSARAWAEEELCEYMGLPVPSEQKTIQQCAAAQLIQGGMSGWVTRQILRQERAASTLQGVLQGRNIRVEFEDTRAAGSRIQGMVRARTGRDEVLQTKAVQVLQGIVLGRHARNMVEEIWQATGCAMSRVEGAHPVARPSSRRGRIKQICEGLIFDTSKVWLENDDGSNDKEWSNLNLSPIRREVFLPTPRGPLVKPRKDDPMDLLVSPPPREDLDRIRNRQHFLNEFCKSRDVAELA